MKILFVGAARLSIVVLKTLLHVNCKIIAICSKRITRTTMVPNAIYYLALRNKVDVYVYQQVFNYQNFRELISSKIDLAIVASYGLVIPKKFLAIPKLGFLDVHASDLPRLRGVAPALYNALFNNTDSFLCVFQVTKEIDKGFLLKKKIFNLDLMHGVQCIANRVLYWTNIILLDLLRCLKKDIVSYERQLESFASYTKRVQITSKIVSFFFKASNIKNVIKALFLSCDYYCNWQSKMLRVILIKTNSKYHCYYPGTVLNCLIAIACSIGVCRLFILKKRAGSFKNTDLIESIIETNSIIS